MDLKDITKGTKELTFILGIPISPILFVMGWAINPSISYGILGILIGLFALSSMLFIFGFWIEFCIRLFGKGD